MIKNGADIITSEDPNAKLGWQITFFRGRRCITADGHIVIELPSPAALIRVGVQPELRQ